MQHKTTLCDMARMVVDRIVCSPVNSKYSIELSLYTPLNNRPCLSLVHPGVLRQCFSRNISEYLGQNSSESSGNETIITTLMVQGVVHHR